MHTMRIVELRRNVFRILGICLAFTAVVFAGCGTPTAKLSGKVTGEGVAVTAGTLVFTPTEANSGGTPVTISIKSDGTYETTTAPLGKVAVSYLAPPAAYPAGYEPKPSEPAPESPFAGLIVEKKDFEVKAGNNTLDIPLIRLKALPKIR